MPVADLSAGAAKARNQDEKTPELIEAGYAYLVYTRRDSGQVVITADINTPVVPERPATQDEVFMTSHTIIKDIQGQQYAAMSAQANLQLNSFLAQQASANQQVADLGLGVAGMPGRRHG